MKIDVILKVLFKIDDILNPIYALTHRIVTIILKNNYYYPH